MKNEIRIVIEECKRGYIVNIKPWPTFRDIYKVVFLSDEVIDMVQYIHKELLELMNISGKEQENEMP